MGQGTMGDTPRAAYGAHWLILLMSVLSIPYCDIRLLQLKQGAAGPPESLGKSAARISPAGTPRRIPGRARPGIRNAA